MAMDYIREFDIRLEKEMYYAGETVYGVVILDTVENFKLRGKHDQLAYSTSFRSLSSYSRYPSKTAHECEKYSCESVHCRIAVSSSQSFQG